MFRKDSLGWLDGGREVARLGGLRAGEDEMVRGEKIEKSSLATHYSYRKEFKIDRINCNTTFVRS